MTKGLDLSEQRNDKGLDLSEQRNDKGLRFIRFIIMTNIVQGLTP
jgi:hypothetical protein